MIYIKKLNIDFDQWEELNKCTYLIFKSINYIYLGYIIKKDNKYRIVLLNTNDTYGLHVIDNINRNELNNKYILYKNSVIKYKNLIETDFYQKNKVLIVGIDVDKEEIIKNPELYSNNEFKNKIKMKYIKKLNIDFDINMKYIKELINFDNWNELDNRNDLNNECIYLIFKSGNRLYLGYIIDYKIHILKYEENGGYTNYNIKVINNINRNELNNKYILYKNSVIKYKNLIETDFYKNNKILIVGIDVDKEEIIKNPELYKYKC